MARNYSLSVNPFVYGLAREDFEFTDKTCGLETIYEFKMGPPPHYEYKKLDSNYRSMNRLEKTAFFAGRLIRFGISVPGTIVDIILQAFECIAKTLERIAAKGESSLRGIRVKKTFFMKHPYLSNLCRMGDLTICEPTILATDLGLIKPYTKVPRFADAYAYHFLG